MCRGLTHRFSIDWPLLNGTLNCSPVGWLTPLVGCHHQGSEFVTKLICCAITNLPLPIFPSLFPLLSTRTHSHSHPVLTRYWEQNKGDLHFSPKTIIRSSTQRQNNHTFNWITAHAAEASVLKNAKLTSFRLERGWNETWLRLNQTSLESLLPERCYFKWSIRIQMNDYGCTKKLLWTQVP